MTTGDARSAAPSDNKMTRLAYFDLASGASGDMILACLAHAGRRIGIAAESAITEAIDRLQLDASVTFVDDERGGLACLRAEVKTGDSRHTAAELRASIEQVGVSPRARSMALAALGLLVEAESTVHGTDAAEVHLHELASADTAADVLGAAVGLDVLGVSRVASAPVPVPSGWISSEHGPLPLPAPATLEVLRGAVLRGVDGAKELVTPTGAAILVAHGATFGTAPEMTLETVAVAAGARRERAGDRPNVCRLLLGQPSSVSATGTQICVVLEANIDDQTPEAIAHAADALLARGALDVWVTPIVMKKSRPAFAVSVLVRPADEPLLTEELFRSTSTLGIRRRETTRSVLDREEVRVDVDSHAVRVKIGRLGAEVVNVAPEFDDCAAVADATGLRLADVFTRAEALARRSIAGRA